MKQTIARDCEIKLLTENQAAQDMWLYYRAHRAEIHSDVRQYRDVILTQLMQGVAVEKVFAPFSLYAVPEEPAEPAKSAKTARTSKAARTTR